MWTSSWRRSSLRPLLHVDILLETLFSSAFAPCGHPPGDALLFGLCSMWTSCILHEAARAAAAGSRRPRTRCWRVTRCSLSLGGRGAPHGGGRGQKGCPGLRPKDSRGQRSAGVAGRRCSSSAQQSPTLLAPGTGFGEDNFSMDGVGRGWFPDDLSALYLLCTLLLLHQLHLPSSGIGPQRLETPALAQSFKQRQRGGHKGKVGDHVPAEFGLYVEIQFFKLMTDRPG